MTQTIFKKSYVRTIRRIIRMLEKRAKKRAQKKQQGNTDREFFYPTEDEINSPFLK